MNMTIETIEAMSHVVAMKQALEALEYHTAQTRPITQTQDAITALRTAIEQAAVPEAHKKQEPLTDEQIKRAKPVCADFVSFRAGVRCVEAMLREKDQTAQRPVAEPHKWVGLTEQEWERLVELYGDDPDILIRETEAKLREKNGGSA